MTPAHTYDRPTRPTFARNDPEEGNMDKEEGNVIFGDNIMTLHDEWDALP